MKKRTGESPAHGHFCPPSGRTHSRVVCTLISSPPFPSHLPISGSSHQPHSSQNPKMSSHPHPSQQQIRSVLSPTRPPPASLHLAHLSLPAQDSLLAPGTRRMKSRLQIDFKTTVQLVLEAGTCPFPHCTPEPVSQDLVPGQAEEGR